MLENKYYYKGFTYAELMKSRVFLDNLSEGLLEPDKGISPDIDFSYDFQDLFFTRTTTD
jgi:hypothetical protein